MTITEEIARKVLSTIDCGLSHGVGRPEPGHMCVEAAVCFALGEPHGDDPSCVDTVYRHTKISLNDSNVWESPESRARGLRRLGICQLGTRGNTDQPRTSGRILDLAIQTILPLAAERFGASEEVQAIANQRNQDAVRRLLELDVDAPSCPGSLSTVVWILHDGLTFPNPVGQATSAADAACTLAEQVRDESILVDFIEGIVQIAVEMETPGSKFLFLTED